MIFSLRTLAYLTTATALTVACICATEQVATNSRFVNVPFAAVFTFAYVSFLLSLLHLTFGQVRQRPFHGGFSIVLVGYFVLRILKIEYYCGMNTAWWLELFESNDVSTASRSSDICTVGIWILAAVLAGIYAQWIAKQRNRGITNG